MSHTQHRADVESTSDTVDLDDFASYEDGDATVICDRNAPDAWVRSTITFEVSP